MLKVNIEYVKKYVFGHWSDNERKFYQFLAERLVVDRFGQRAHLGALCRRRAHGPHDGFRDGAGECGKPHQCQCLFQAGRQ